MSKKTLFITIGVIVVIGAIATTIITKRANGVPYELATVQKGSIVQEVSASGKVESPVKIDLHFKNNDKLIAVNTKVGKKVVMGQLLARQDTSELSAQLAEMQASVEVQKAKLEQVLAGASEEDIAITETEVVNAEVSFVNAQQSLDNSKQNLIDKLKDAYTKSDDAVRNKADQLFSNPRSSSPQLISGLAIGSTLGNNAEWERILIRHNVFTTWKDSLDQLAFQSDFITYINETRQNLSQVSSFLDVVALAVNSATANSNISQTSLDKWRTDITTARTNINTAMTNLSSAEEKFNTGESNLKVAEGHLKSTQDKLILKKAPVRSTDIALYEAQIRQAEASMQRVQTQISERSLLAPLSGTITEVNGEVGETVGSNKSTFSLATDGALQIKLNVVEDNIVNVRVGQEAKITFDAIEEQEFVGSVTAIDPAETIVGGAVYYQTTILFEKKDEHIRSGMTANVWIKTSISENTLFVPASAVQNSDSKKIVQVLEGKQAVEKEITTGIKNDAGMIEITSGLSEGEEVIIGNKKKRSKK